MITVNLEKLHKIQIELANEVKRICEKNEISYFLIAGTLLGAIRHNGFIPWDDDMDIGMFREDYDNFLVACRTDLNSDYYLQTWETDSRFGLPIAKLRKNGTTFVERNSANSQIHNGIYIDIFPYDNIPDNKLHRLEQKISTSIYKRLVLLKNNYELENKKNNLVGIFVKVLKHITKYVSRDNLIEKYERQIMRYNKKNTTNKVTIFGGAYSYDKEAILREWIINTIEHDFEDIRFCIPNSPHLMLKSIYGDYTKLPPETERHNRHGIIEVDYGE